MFLSENVMFLRRVVESQVLLQMLPGENAVGEVLDAPCTPRAEFIPQTVTPRRAIHQFCSTPKAIDFTRDSSSWNRYSMYSLAVTSRGERKRASGPVNVLFAGASYENSSSSNSFMYRLT